MAEVIFVSTTREDHDVRIVGRGVVVGGICKYNRERSKCKDCGGSKVCEHNKIKSQCKDCGGSQICQHNKIKSQCKYCGGSQICEHSKRRSTCKDCGGSQVCEYNKQRSKCLACDPLGQLARVVKHRVYPALKTTKK